MKKVFAIFAFVGLFAFGVQASEPLSGNEPDGNISLQSLQLGSLHTQPNLFASSTEILQNEVTGSVNDFENYSDFSRRRKSKAGPVLTCVGIGCLVVGGTLAGIGISQIVGKINDEKELNELYSENPLAATEAEANKEEETPGKMFGRIAMIGGGGLMFVAGIPLTIIGAKLWSNGGRSKHRRHSELIDTRYPSTNLTFNTTGTSAALTLSW